MPNLTGVFFVDPFFQCCIPCHIRMKNISGTLKPLSGTSETLSIPLVGDNCSNTSAEGTPAEKCCDYRILLISSMLSRALAKA